MSRILLAASGGGHLDQLALIAQDLPEEDVLLATSDLQQARHLSFHKLATLPDCNLHQPWRSIRCGVSALRLVMMARPRIVISTGAAPGFFCVMWGRLAGARTLWIDSIANAEQLSLSGRLARIIAHDCLTQWQHLADRRSVRFAGSLL